MATSPSKKRGKPNLPALPLTDVPAAALDFGPLVMPPLTPLATLNTSSSLTPGALPLLVQMPDGQRKQVELPPSASVGDLRHSLGAPENWDFNFNSETLDSTKQLSSYNINNAYDHAGGLLKMIDSSQLQPEQKLDALEKAVSVVKGISRGERDLNRIMDAALGYNSPSVRQASNSPFVQDHGGSSAHTNGPAVTKGALSSFGIPKRADPADGGNSFRDCGNPFPLAPPTPSELIRRLGESRPDLYPPRAAERMMSDLVKIINQGSAHNRTQGNSRSNAGAGAQVAASFLKSCNIPSAELKSPRGELPAVLGSGALNDEVCSSTAKLGNTWFEDVVSSLIPDNYCPQGPSAMEQNRCDRNGQDQSHVADGDDDDIVGADELHDGSDDSDDDDSGISPVSKNKLSHQSEAQSSGGDVSADVSEATSSRANATGHELGAKVPKKRGRKRKNPELSEEQRKALRQAQNRESAKQSRLRRKSIAAEYEKQVTNLSSENETLRDTISALRDRLQFLQGLLTVSVTQRAASGMHSMPSGPSVGSMPVVPNAPMPLMSHHAPSGTAPNPSDSSAAGPPGSGLGMSGPSHPAF